uniref:PS II complex 12 kDa extrinsic protein n=1 Tax=Odontella aurita TaxID=265563 RepID=A0A7S4I8R6_9STRA
MTSVRLCLLAALLGHSASGCSAFAPSSAGGVVRRSTAPALRMSPSSADDGSDASSVSVSSRRAFFRDSAAASASAASAVLLSSPSASYAAATPPTSDELKRIKTGHDGILYLLDNWDKETTVCRENGGECKRDADAVRKYLGLRSTTDPLFQIEKVFNKVKYMDLDPDKLDDFFEAAE